MSKLFTSALAINIVGGIVALTAIISGIVQAFQTHVLTGLLAVFFLPYAIAQAIASIFSYNISKALMAVLAAGGSVSMRR